MSTRFQWEEFIGGASRAFWADAYMHLVEELAEKHLQAYRALSPGPGGQWLDIPTVPGKAHDVGRKFAKLVKDKATDADLVEMKEKMRSISDAGWYAAMGAMGHGVGLWDYDIDFKVPHFSGEDYLYNEAQDAVQLALDSAGFRINALEL
jgi:hypothetical protein